MKQRIKLLLLVPHLGGGGAERVVALLARHLPPERFEIHLALFTPDGAGAEAPPRWVTLHRLRVARVRHGWWKLVRLILREQPDVMLSGMAHLNCLVLLLGWLLPHHARVLVRQNTMASTSRSKWMRFGYSWLYPGADAILCQTQAMADDLREHFGIAAKKLAVLPNPVEAVFRPADAGAMPEAPLLVAVGRLAPEKGFDLLLRALSRIRLDFPTLQLKILGIGAEEGNLRRLAAELALQDCVTFTGYADPLQSYAGASLFVLSSRHEGMPNALLEAAAAGMPIVATPCEGVKELLGEAPGTWFAASVSETALADAIRTALDAVHGVGPTLMRYEHGFLAPFALERAIAAYADSIAGTDALSDDQKRVAMMIPTLDGIGGAEKQVLLLARELAARGWQVTVIALSGTGRNLQAELAESGIAFLSLGMRKAWIDPRGWTRYLKWWRTHRPQIVHTHLPHATWFGRWSRLLAPVCAVVDTVHTSRTESHGGGSGRRRGYRMSRWLSNHVTCVSQQVAQAVVRAGMAAPGNLSVIGNGVEQPQPAPNRPVNPVFRWIALGRLAPVKDYPTLLRAFALVVDWFPGVTTLEIVGDGPEEARLKALARELGIQDQVAFVGFQANVEPLLAAADAFVLASLWEGLPVSVLEASAAGLPVVATDAAGTNEALVAGGEARTGLLAPVADAVAIAEAMRSVLEMSPAERQQMGENGRRFVAERYSLPRIVDEWEGLYCELLRQHGHAARMPHQ